MPAQEIIPSNIAKTADVTAVKTSVDALATQLGTVAQDSSVDAIATALGSPAQNATVAATNTSLGTDGATPPTIAGTGVRGWLRAIYETLTTTLTVTVSGEVEVKNDSGNPLAVSASSLPLPTGAATDAALTTLDASVDAVTTSLGADGNTPPSIAGTGVRGWLRAIYEATISEGTEKVRVVGNPAGDFADLDLMDEVVDDQGDLSLQVRVRNWPKQDAVGAQMWSDAPTAIQWYNGAVGPGPIIDTTGYESIVVGFSGANGTYLFQTANDPAQFTTALANAAGWTSAAAAAPVTSIAAAAGGVYVIPVTGKYFRLYCSVAGTAGMITMYQRATPASFTPNAQNVTISSGTVTTVSTVSAATVNGNVAAGSAASGNPVTVAGADLAGLVRIPRTDASGYLSGTGPLRAGWIVGTFNQSFGGYTQVLASQSAAFSTFAPVVVGGVDMDSGGAVRNIATDYYGRLIVRPSPSTTSELSEPAMLQQIAAAQQATVHLLTQLVAICRGLPDPTLADEADELISEFLDRRSNFQNLAN